MLTGRERTVYRILWAHSRNTRRSETQLYFSLNRVTGQLYYSYLDDIESIALFANEHSLEPLTSISGRRALDMLRHDGLSGEARMEFGAYFSWKVSNANNDVPWPDCDLR